MRFLGTYNSADVETIINGRTLSAYGAEPHIAAARNEENEFDTVVGVNGDFTYVKNNDKSGSVSINLKQLSQDSIYLSSLAEAEAIFTIVVRHKNEALTEIINIVQGIVMTRPRLEFNKSDTDRLWVLGAGSLSETVKS